MNKTRLRGGMLWFDNDGRRTLEDKLERAARYYEARHGSRPTVCMLHPSTAMGHDCCIGGMDIQAANTVLPHHFWLGQDGAPRHRSAA
jgi:hypothetical protein